MKIAKKTRLQEERKNGETKRSEKVGPFLFQLKTI
jgi:hypothetical protein